VYNFASGDPHMDAAIETARGTLPAFLDHRLAPEGASQQQTLLKVGVPTLGRSDDRACLGHAFKQMSKGLHRGALVNEPAYEIGLERSEVFEFSRDQITDWAFFGSNGKLYGGYTLRVTVAQHLEAGEGYDFAEPPLPKNW